MNNHLKDALDYFKGFYEGDNITITADFVNNVEEIEEGLNKKDKGEIKMEKDKLMELINSMTKERKEINDTIEKQTTDKTIKGLNVIYECLKYGDEMAGYFRQVGIGRCGIAKVIGNIQFIFNGDNFEVDTYDGICGWYPFSLRVFKNNTINQIAITESNFRHLNSGARAVVDKEFTLSKFKDIVNERLANGIVSYQKETDRLKESLK